jgi:hypothetical protein
MRPNGPSPPTKGAPTVGGEAQYSIPRRLHMDLHQSFPLLIHANRPSWPVSLLAPRNLCPIPVGKRPDLGCGSAPPPRNAHYFVVCEVGRPYAVGRTHPLPQLRDIPPAGRTTVSELDPFCQMKCGRGRDGRGARGLESRGAGEEGSTGAGGQQGSKGGGRHGGLKVAGSKFEVRGARRSAIGSSKKLVPCFTIHNM